MNLVERVATIESRQDLISFMQALLRDLRENPEEWWNPTLEGYLEAFAAWVDDMDGYYLSRSEPIPEQPTWKVIGDILMGARVYE